jgi:hypothetical protein
VSLNSVWSERLKIGKIQTANPSACGAIAQLGERIVRNDEVVGSIPTSSTMFSITCNHPILRHFKRLSLIGLLCYANLLATAQETAVFRSSSSLVLVDVIAQDKKTGISFEHLKQEDFQVLDNDHPVTISSIDRSEGQIRPLALWLVVICPERGWKDQGSGFFKSKAPLLASAVARLNQNDTMGVAHWCDNGDVQIDLAPTGNREIPLLVLENVLQAREIDHPWPAPLGQLALERMIQLIGDNARRTRPQPLPAIVFIHGDQTDLPEKRAQQMAEGLLATSSIVYGVNNGAMLSGSQTIINTDVRLNLIHFMAAETGGQVIAVKHDAYADALTKIIEELHLRYDLGFVPPSVDDEYHNLRVKLTDVARHQYGNVMLRYRAGYVPSLRIGRFPGFDEPLLTDADVGAALGSAVKSPITYTDILFDVTAKADSAGAPTAKFTLKVNGAGLTWGQLPSGEHREQVMIVAASLSEAGEAIDTVVKKFEVMESGGAGNSADKSVVISFSGNIPPNARRFRFVIRDSQTGRIGIKDLTREQLFSVAIP